MPIDIIAPRANTTQQVNFERRTLTFATQGVRLWGSIPVGSVITNVNVSVTVPFNGGTNAITLGTTQSGAELLAAADSTPGTAGYYTNARGLGLVATQAASPPSAVGDPEGGVGLWLTYAPTGAAPTAGSCVVTVSFIPPVDV